MTEYTADILTEMGIKFLRERYPDAIVMKEFCGGKWGVSSIDLAAITKNRIIGMEIKGEGDSFARLSLQGPTYAMVANTMFLVLCPSLAEKNARIRKVPRRWHLLEIDEDALKVPRYFDRFEEQKYGRLDNSPYRLLGLLWKKELIAAARQVRVDAVHRENVDTIINRIAELAPLGEIRKAVVGQLWGRNWAYKEGLIYHPEYKIVEGNYVPEPNQERML